MQIESLTNEHFAKPFSSAESETTRFWFERAFLEHSKWRCGTTKVLVDDDQQIVGYYTLAMQTISLQYGEENYPKDRKVTGILIGQLAINKDYEGRGLSKILLKSSFKDIIVVAKQIGVYVIIVDPVSDNLISFWEKYGFKRFNNNSLRMLYPMKLLLPTV